jgi:CheY-like chemotaxis protein
MSTITFLHLADLHFQAGAAFESFNLKRVLDALWEDIKSQAAELKPDFIVFTGDVSYHGKREEYDLAIEHFFDPLLRITKIPKERLFIVPGNHDVNWGMIDPVSAFGMPTLLGQRDRINEFLGPNQDRSFYFRKFQPYANFINDYLGESLSFSDIDYFYTRVIEVSGYKLGILGLNSAWMSAYIRDSQGKVSDQGNLLIGEQQLVNALEATEGVDLQLAILHHPLSWLHETELFEIEKQLEARHVLIAHGHWHTPRVTITHSLAGQSISIPTGSIYACRDYPNGYNIVQLDLASLQGIISFRRYNDKGNEGPEWQKDTLSTGDERDGKFVFELFPTTVETMHFPSSIPNRVLLVEDQPNWQRTIRSILIPSQYDMEIVTSYVEAIEKLQDHFDLAIVNLCLVNDSDYTGIAVLEALLEKKCPGIVLTGSATTARSLFEQYNVREVFIKGNTFNVPTFLREVKKILREQLVNNGN